MRSIRFTHLGEVMIPALLTGLGLGYVVAKYLGNKSPSDLLNLKSPVKPKTAAGFGICTPARARLHGHLLTNEHNPDKLMRAAGLYNQFGLEPQAASLMTKANDVIAQANVAAELVERSRSGDQNAIGMIASIHDQAAKGNLRARISAVLIDDYITEHPVLTPPPMIGPMPGPVGPMPGPMPGPIGPMPGPMTAPLMPPN